MPGISALQEYIFAFDFKTNQSDMHLKSTKNGLIAIKKLGFFDRIQNVLGIGGFNIKEIRKELTRLSNENSEIVSLVTELIGVKGNKKGLQEASIGKLFDVQAGCIETKIQNSENLKDLNQLKKQISVLWSSLAKLKVMDGSRLGKMNRLQTQITKKSMPEAMKQELDDISNKNLQQLSDMLIANKDRPISSQILQLHEIKERLATAEDKNREEYFNLVEITAEKFQKAGYFSIAKSYFHELVDNEHVEPDIREDCLEQLSNIMLSLHQYDELQHLLQKIPSKTEDMEETEREIQKTIKNLREFSSISSDDSEKRNGFTQKEWKAIQELLKFYNDPTYDGNYKLIENFFLYVTNNKEINIKINELIKLDDRLHENVSISSAKALNHNVALPDDLLQILHDISIISFKSSPHYIIDGIKSTDRLMSVYNLHQAKPEKARLEQAIKSQEQNIDTYLPLNTPYREEYTKELKEKTTADIRKIEELQEQIDQITNDIQWQTYNVTELLLEQKDNFKIEKISMSSIRQAYSMRNAFLFLSFLDVLASLNNNPILSGCYQAAASAETTFEQIDTHILQDDFETGDISIRNALKFNQLAKKSQGIIDVVSPFGHTALVDVSESALDFSHVMGKHMHEPISTEDSLTHDRFRLLLHKAISKDGKGKIGELAQEKEIDLETFLRDELQEAVEIEFSSDHQIDTQLLEEIAQLEIPDLAWDNLPKYLEKINATRIKEQKEPITLEDFLVANPEAETVDPARLRLPPTDLSQEEQKNLNERIEKIKHGRSNKKTALIKKAKAMAYHASKIRKEEELATSQNEALRNRNVEELKQKNRIKFQEKKFESIKNSAKLQEKAFKRSWLAKMSLRQKVNPEAIKMTEDMICSQFAMSILLRATARVEKKLKDDYVNLHPEIDRKSLDKQSWFKIPKFTNYQLTAMTPHVVTNALKKFLDPLQAPKIYQELLDAPKEFFTPSPILSTIQQLASLKNRLN